MSTPVVIPAYNPTERLLALLRELGAHGAPVIVVDDGSTDPESRRVLKQAAALPCCLVLAHAENRGKGQALKTGFTQALAQFPSAAGVVTADCDGQHLPADILRVMARLEREPGALVLGARTFGKDTPIRSLIGNTLTGLLMRLVIGRRITDTQTGLRGLPMSRLRLLTVLPGAGYEYEMHVLTTAHRYDIPIVEEPISTVYLDDNASSHFNPLLDSMKVTFALLRFGLSSLLASGVDFLVFVLIYAFLHQTLVSLVCARVAASMLNFAVNRSLVFRVHHGSKAMMVKYYLLIVTMLLLSYQGISLLMTRFGLQDWAAKIITETALFPVSFILQREVVFTESSHLEPASQHDDSVV